MVLRGSLAEPPAASSGEIPLHPFFEVYLVVEASRPILGHAAAMQAPDAPVSRCCLGDASPRRCVARVPKGQNNDERPTTYVYI